MILKSLATCTIPKIILYLQLGIPYDCIVDGLCLAYRLDLGSLHTTALHFLLYQSRIYFHKKNLVFTVNETMLSPYILHSYKYVTGSHIHHFWIFIIFCRLICMTCTNKHAEIINICNFQLLNNLSPCLVATQFPKSCYSTCHIECLRSMHGALNVDEKKN